MDKLVDAKDFEIRLYEILSDSKPSEYEEVIAAERDIDLLYQLATERTNIISWFEIQADAKVLEIGSGYGAITGYLANKAAHVTCIAETNNQQVIAAKRLAGFDNVKLMHGDYKDAAKALRDKYDVITLIGVDVDDELLSICAERLAIGGIIIVSGIEFANTVDSANLTDTLDNNNSDTKVSHIKDFAASYGFTEATVYYPYPDYLLPTTIYSDEFLPVAGEETDSYEVILRK